MRAKPAADFSWLPVDAVEPWAKNPRKNDPAVPEVAKSILRFGFVSPIVVWTSRSRIVAGHTRVKALRLLLTSGPNLVENQSQKRGPGFVPKGAPGPGLVPVRFQEFADEAEANAYAVADNRLGELAEWDDALLADVLRDLGTVDGGLEGIGADDWDLLGTLDVGTGTGHVEPSDGDDNAPEVKQGEPDSKTGEVYELGPHRLVCGDCLLAETWVLLLSGAPYDLLLTDPPYGVSYAGKNEFLNQYDKGNANQTAIENDARSPEEMRKFWTESLSMAFVHAKPGAVYYSTGPQGGDLLLLLLLAFKDSGWLLKHNLIWVKNNHVLGRCDFHYKHEPILYGWKPGAGHYFSDEPGACFSTWEVDKPNQSKEHPTMKPVALFEKAIGHGSRPGGIVADPFSGSGTTLIACAMTGRVARCIEIDPHYCDVIRRRWTRWAREHNQDPGPGALV